MGTSRLIDHTAHRPYPVPARPWVLRQTWSELAFLHWPLPVEQLRPLIPAALQLDTYDGMAWLGIVPFRMSHVSLRYLPPLPLLSFFPEMNLRTYVTAADGKAGVYFFSLDAGNPIAVMLGRRCFRLPYFNAAMNITQQDGTVHYTSRRRHHRAASAVFDAHYRPTGEVYHAAHGSLDHWLTERYCLYTSGRYGVLLRGEIHHRQWDLQHGEVEIAANTMTQQIGIAVKGTPLVHYVHNIRMLGWLLERVKSPAP